MPLKVIPPQAGRSPNCLIRGTYLGHYVHRSAGTPNQELARKIRDRLKKDIERGAYTSATEPTLNDAAKLYLTAGRSDPYLVKVTDRYGDTALSQIDQIKVDAWAAELYPRATPATRNRQVYTPVAAVMHHAHPTLIATWLHLKRPAGSQGEQRTRWATPEQIAALAAAAGPTVKPLLTFLVATGCRISEAVRLDWADVELERSFCYLGRTKNGEARAVHIPPAAVAELANILVKTGLVFGFSTRFEVYDGWREMTDAAGLPWVTPHVCRHTYGTWMRIYGGLDELGLLATGVWKDRKSVARYTHVVASSEAKKADALPIGMAPKKDKAG